MKNIKITKNTANLSNQHNNNNITPPPPPQHNRHLGKNLVLLIGLLALPLFSQAQTIIDSAESTIQTLGSPNATITVTEAGSISIDTVNSSGIYANSTAINAIIINNGTISTNNTLAYGINSVAANVSITNNGTITTIDSLSHNIYSEGDNAIITHSGTITAMGNAVVGIIASGADSIITVSGRISSTGANNFAVSGGSNKQTLTLEGNYDIAGIIDLEGGTDTVNINGIGAGTATSIVFHNVETVNLNDPRLSQDTTGTITTVTINRPVIINDARTTQQTLSTPSTTITVTEAGSIAIDELLKHGIAASTGATNATIINNGTISVISGGSFGINSLAADVSITNNGTINAINTAVYGIYSNGANVIINHSGTITTTKDASAGIIAIGANSEITVSGRISATGAGSFAVSGGTYTNTLNLEGDYDITGDIDLGDGIDTVNIDGIGAGTATSIVFHNVENIDYNMNPRFKVIEDGNTKTITINRGALPNPNNGCTLNANTDKKPFDPILPLLALLAGGYLLNRKLKLS